ncbi:class II DAHP synthetase family protein [Metarhizium acridum CQMa 102]|uniref:Phospho-2-dehydro-3-deoxyheptonate aldolase n=1 Tax=Metarhizium acridum (strain CQMa 102) TaxID=655827 RepID=E9EF14_METAQ|nr:class II DAHP synthetase family protein [Metarhizium acridum CQMa 102]EFY85515.1 class II DAHP synthetase family protein [Metarhizium acridum CQMa 102]
MQTSRPSSVSHKPAWSPQSWRSQPVHEQRIIYADESHLHAVLTRLSELPPLVTPARIEAARKRYAAAARGEAFLLLGGDCAESFDDTKDHIIAQKIELLYSQARRIEAATGLPVHIMARIAGQYSKPRSKLTEITSDGREVSAFRGHNVNGPAITDREPDPNRLLHGYWHSVAILHKLVSTGVPLATAHEALHLPFESSLTKGGYNTSATFLWIGDRTRQLDGAHLEYVRGLRNPIGVKIGPTTNATDVVQILESICGKDSPSEPGRVTLITRMGADQVKSKLPAILAAVKKSPYLPVWMCDPCHGNTFSHQGNKTRSLEVMLREVKYTIDALAAHGLHLGGLHLEQTGEQVVECVDAVPDELDHVDLRSNYKSLCDPRLSREQAQRFVDKVSDMLSDVEKVGKQRCRDGQEEYRARFLGTPPSVSPLELIPSLVHGVPRVSI